MHDGQSSPTSPESVLERGPSLDDDTIRPGKVVSMKRPSYAADLSVLIRTKSHDRSQHGEGSPSSEEVLSATSLTSSIFQKYGGEDTPLTPPLYIEKLLHPLGFGDCDNGSGASLKAQDLSEYQQHIPNTRERGHPDMDILAEGHLRSRTDLGNYGTHSLRTSPSLSSIPETAIGSRMPSLDSASGHRRAAFLRKTSSNASLTGLDRQVDLFGFQGHGDLSNYSTPALTSDSETTASSRPVSQHNQHLTWDADEWRKRSSTASNSITSMNNLTYESRKSMAYLSPGDAEEVLPASPITPSKVGLGITTPDEECEDFVLEHTPKSAATPSNTPMKPSGSSTRDTPSPSFAAVSGRQRITAGSRSRSSSVAERVERARHSISQNTTAVASSSPQTDSIHRFGSPLMEDRQQHCVGIDTLPSFHAVSWSLKSTRPSLSVVSALHDAPSLLNLTSLNISDCDLSEIPVSITAFMSLQHLDISDNTLVRRTLPTFLGSLSSLQALIADRCDLHTLSYPFVNWAKLTTLSLKKNQLHALPSWLSHLDSLQNLMVEGNPFVGQWADLVKPLLLQQQRSCDGMPNSDHTIARLYHNNRSRASLTESDLESNPSPVDPSMFTRTAPLKRPHYSSHNSYTSVQSTGFSAVGSPLSSVSMAPSATNSTTQSHVSSRSQTHSTFSPISAHSLSFADSKSDTPTAFSRPDTSHSLQGSKSVSNLKKMKSVGDLGSIRESQRLRASSIAPDAVSPPSSSPQMQEKCVSTTVLASSNATKNKTASFLKKMGSFGRSRRETEHGSKRPHLLQEADRAISAPSTPSLAQSTRQTRERTLSSAGLLESNAPAKRVSRLHLSSIPQSALAGRVVAVSTHDDTELTTEDEDEQETAAVVKEGANALQSLMAYLRDLDDLSAPHHTSIRLGSSSRHLSRTSSTCSSRADLKQSYLSEGSGGVNPITNSNGSSSSCLTSEFSSDARQPHSSTSTSMSSVSSFSAQGLPAKTKNDANKRERVINEILATERSYVKSLQELCDIYVKPASNQTVHRSLTSSSSSAKESIVPAAERRAVFSNVEELLTFHRDVFLPDLDRVSAELYRQRKSVSSDSSVQSLLLRRTAEDIANVFNRHGQFLKMYSIYVNNFDNALRRLQTWCAPSGSPLPGSTVSSIALSEADASGMGVSATAPALGTTQRRKIRSFMKACRNDPRHAQMNIESYLLMPVQRIPRYKMLLESMMSCTPADEESGQPNARIYTALGLVTSLASDLNEKKRESEARQRLLHWQSRIGNKFRSPLVQPHRILLKEARITLSRIVKRSEEYISTSPLTTPNNSYDSEPTLVQVPSLKVEGQNKALVALLTNDLLVFAYDNKLSSGPIDLFCVIRLGNITHNECASVFGGSSSTLRLVDPRSIMYLDMESPIQAAEWAMTINCQLSAF